MNPFLSSLLQTTVPLVVGEVEERLAGEPGAEKHQAAFAMTADQVSKIVDIYSEEQAELRKAIDDLIKAVVRVHNVVADMDDAS